MINQLTQRLFANKFLLTAVSISAAILLIILIISSRQPSTTTTLDLNSEDSVSNPFAEFTNLTEEKVNNAISYRKIIQDRLPIRMRDFKTTVGISLSIDITTHPTEPSLTRLDITGLSYLNKDETDPKKNPNIQAFKEGYAKALQLLKESGIEPKQLIFSYGEADYVRVTANYWVDVID
ncbi:hypothetical protein KBD69_00785 [Candidatus Woesebacteria bacterium]|nr:hypothetical protein [Candidatus Woesebacteria bacterium]